MISYIRGELAALEEDKVIVDVGGVGYGIYMSGQSMDLLPHPGEEVKIYTYLNVKEDAMQLYGFLTRDDLSVFKLLLGVNGIGPKGGLGILSVLSPDDLRMAVVSNDAKAIAKAPGIGKKTAEKLILELRDKFRLEDVLAHDSERLPENITVPGSNELQREAAEALTALGYTSTEALKAVRRVPLKEDMKAGDVLKQALKHMI